MAGEQQSEVFEDRWSLNAYLTQLKLDDPRALQAQADEIMSRAKVAIGSYARAGDDSFYAMRWGSVMKRLEDAYASGDFKGQFPAAVRCAIAETGS